MPAPQPPASTDRLALEVAILASELGAADAPLADSQPQPDPEPLAPEAEPAPDPTPRA